MAIWTPRKFQVLTTSPLENENGLVGRWCLDGTGTDWSGNSNNGSIVGGASPAQGIVGESLLFGGAGSNQYVTVPSNATLQPANITLTAWFNLKVIPSGPNYAAIVSMPRSAAVWTAPYLSFILRINSATVIEYDLVSSSYVSSTATVPTILVGTWHHVAMTYAGGVQTLYFDGVKVGSTSFTGPIGYTVGQPLMIGADNGATPVGEITNGYINDVRIYNRGLSGAEINAIYNQALAFQQGQPEGEMPALWTPSTAYSLALASGSYTVAGSAAVLKTALKVGLATGAYSLSGSAASLVAARKIALASGAYSLAGSGASFKVAWHVALASGAYALSGSAATFKTARGLPLAAGAYALSGSAATLTYAPGSHAAYSLALGSGSYLLAGSPASLVAVIANQMDMHDGGGGKKKPRPLPWTKEDEVKEKRRRAALDAAEEARREKPSESVRAAVEAAVAAQKPKVDEPEPAPSVAPVVDLKVNAPAKPKAPAPETVAPLGKIAVAKELPGEDAPDEDADEDAITALLLTL